MHPGLNNILNYRAYDARLACSGQPTREQFEAIRDAGYELVINLACDDSPGALNDEAEIVTSLGMQYRHLPVDFKHPELSDLDDFFRLMQDNRGKHCFIHCAYNWRVSAFMYLYQTRVLGMDQSNAEAVMHDIWTPDATWSDFIKRAEREETG